MRKYVKPIAVVNSNLAEGVYAASGASGNGAYALREIEAWSQTKKYDLDITNTSSEKVDSVTVTLKVHGEATSAGGNVTAVISGDTIIVKYDNYGKGLQPNETVQNIYFWVIGNGDFYLE